jgi:Skp family chaperone for outer membrane proteins
MPDRRPRRRHLTLAALLLAVLVSLPAACSRSTDLPAQIDAQIQAYRAEPSDALQSRIEASFAKLDAEIAELRADAETRTGAAKDDALAKADALSARAGELRKSWYGARFAAAGEAAKNAVKQLGVSLGQGLESAGQKMKSAIGGDEKGAGADAAADAAKED